MLDTIKNIFSHANLRRKECSMAISRDEAEIFQPRFDESKIREAIESGVKMFPGKIPVLLTDSDLKASYSCNVIHCNNADSVIIKAYPSEEYLFIYACNIDEIGSPYIKEVIKSGAKFIPVQSYQPSLYHNIRKKAGEVLANEYATQKSNGYLKWGVGAFFARDQLNVMQAIDMTSRLEGDFVEIGCFRGSTSRVSLCYMSAQGISRRCIFLDVFDGFNYPAAESSSDSIWFGTHDTEGIDIVEERLIGAVDTDDNIKVEVIRNNIIEDEFPSNIDDICLAYIDVDIYEAVYEALIKIQPKMVKYGVVVVEDPGHTPALIGARIALDEFMELHGSDFIPIYLESGQTFLVKK